MNRQDEHPLTTIIMPIRNEAAFIRRSLAAVLAQDYPADRLEIIVADGMSDDGTRGIIHELQQEHPNLRLVDNPARIVPTGLNAAIRQARGDIIVRIDGHALVPPDYVSTCVHWLHETGADCVGGAVESVGQGYIGQAIALAMSSPFGVGGSGFRVAAPDARPTLTDTVPFGAYRRQVFQRIGGFDEKMVRHQDYQFCYRLRQSGGKIYLLPHLRAAYYVRATLSSLRRQYWQYGIWKGRFLRAHPHSLRLRHLAPPLFVAALIFTLLLAILSTQFVPLLAIILGAYSLFILAALIYAVRRGHARHALLLPIILPILHLSWGLGVWLGLIQPPLSPQPTNPLTTPP